MEQLQYGKVSDLFDMEHLWLNVYSGYNQKIITQVAQKAFLGRSYKDGFTATWFHISIILLHSRRLDDVDELRLVYMKEERQESTTKLKKNKQIVSPNHLRNKNSTFREAPPTKNPSTSGFAASSLQFAPFTEPEV